MPKIWAKSLAKGNQTWDKCPEDEREEVLVFLRQFVVKHEYNMTAEKYEAITGQPYEAA